MRVRIWGARGSIATPIHHPHLREKMALLLQNATAEDIASEDSIDKYLDESPHAWTHGGNTSCVELAIDGQVIICDAGTGIVGLGSELLKDGRATEDDIHFLFTHFHWDHICGFPFFSPIYQPGKNLHVWSGRSDAGELLAGQMSGAYFPVKWGRLPRSIESNQLFEDAVNQVGDVQVRILPMIHPDKAYGYRVTHTESSSEKTVCYLTDTEVSQSPEKLGPIYSSFVEGADLVVVDAMYGFLECHERVNFGHSTIFNWIDFFRETNIGELVIFHHDPMASDVHITELLEKAKRYKELAAPGANWKLSAAREGQIWDL